MTRICGFVRALLLSCRAKEFMTRDKSGKLKDTGVRFQDIAGETPCLAVKLPCTRPLCLSAGSCIAPFLAPVPQHQQYQHGSHMYVASPLAPVTLLIISHTRLSLVLVIGDCWKPLAGNWGGSNWASASPVSIKPRSPLWKLMLFSDAQDVCCICRYPWSCV
jgi:hypothetical protein